MRVGQMAVQANEMRYGAWLAEQEAIHEIETAIQTEASQTEARSEAGCV